jgi:4-hydroxyphenylpyruvate dioxygenase
MRKSIATVSLSGTLPQKLDAVAAAGFDAIELFEADFINFNGSAATTPPSA